MSFVLGIVGLVFKGLVIGGGVFIVVGCGVGVGGNLEVIKLVINVSDVCFFIRFWNVIFSLNLCLSVVVIWVSSRELRFILLKWVLGLFVVRLYFEIFLMIVNMFEWIFFECWFVFMFMFCVFGVFERGLG